MEDILYRYNPWWEGNTALLEALRMRAQFGSLAAQLENKQVVFLAGLRRIGKTSLMKLCIRHLIENNVVPPEQCLYVSLDDYLLKDTSIIAITDAFRSLHRLKSTDKVYLFLDEITYIPDYTIQLKNLYDSGHTKIVASSSSASLMNDRKALLTGRSVTFEILPLDYPEYLVFRDIKVGKGDSHLHESYFRDFLAQGGIPEHVLTGDSVYIHELVDNIIHKDIAAMHGIRQVGLLKEFFLLLMERSGKTISLNKLARVLGISTETAKRYFELFCEVYLVYPVQRHGKLNEQLVSPKKVYACDTGIRTHFTGARDWGSLFENYVYLRIKHLRPRYIYQNGTELDFFTEGKVLIECKYHDEDLQGKQQELFDRFKARQKLVVRSEADLVGLLAT